MRNIKYIIINDSMPAAPRGKSSNISIDNFGHHYVINSAGAVLNLINVCQPGSFIPKSACGEEDLNSCSIGVKYNGKLTDPKLRPLLISLLLDLRDHFPTAKILAKDEYDRWHTHVRDDMNLLRTELSNIGYNPEPEE
jgi:hypothetical protein